jgi:ATP-dependent DNA helicase RecG
MATRTHTNDPLQTPVQYVKGIGPRRATALEERGLRTVRDLLYYFPRGYIDLSTIETIGNLRRRMNSGAWITVIGNVRAFDLVGRPPQQRVVVILGDETGTVQLLFFRGIHYFKKAFKIGERIAVSGRVTAFQNKPQIVHPSIDRLGTGDEDGERDDTLSHIHTGGIVPKYGSGEDLRDVNLHVKGLRRIMHTTVSEYIEYVKEFLPDEIWARHQFPSLRDAIRNIHFPDSAESLEAARRRLKFDELFTLQLVLALRRHTVKHDLAGIAFRTESALARKLVDTLPFTLTRAQIKVIREITQDMQSARPMNRLLQGDVGSGKTIVALIAMLIALENGYQAAFMAPTEILAEQHFRTITEFLKQLSVNVRLLVGSQRSKLRRDVLDDVQRGSAQIVVGTHALIQEGVEFARLGLAIIDEQHRFGVSQRAALRQKSAGGGDGAPSPDVLIMTATPIPRTLSLTLYGDLDVSIIDELPAHRQTIKTGLRLESQHDRVYQFVRTEVQAGRQVYIVYPLIDESEKLDLRAATESYEHLRKDVFPDLRVALIHGRMPSEEKDAVMADMKEHRIDVLVATTVIEVGVDISNATVMVIEHAERFGLVQLHQLRGRVGRGADQSYCILIAPDWMGKRVQRRVSLEDPMTEEHEEMLRAERRLHAMLETTDGFKIAEIDLELRGPGDFFGTRQSGLPFLEIADLMTDSDILATARAEAFELIDHDPQLRAEKYRALKQHVDDRVHAAIALAQSG